MWIFRGDESRRRRGCRVDSPRTTSGRGHERRGQRIVARNARPAARAAPSRPRRGWSAAGIIRRWFLRLGAAARPRRAVFRYFRPAGRVSLACFPGLAGAPRSRRQSDARVAGPLSGARGCRRFSDRRSTTQNSPRRAAAVGAARRGCRARVLGGDKRPRARAHAALKIKLRQHSRGIRPRAADNRARAVRPLLSAGHERPLGRSHR